MSPPERTPIVLGTTDGVTVRYPVGSDEFAISRLFQEDRSAVTLSIANEELDALALPAGITSDDRIAVERMLGQAALEALLEHRAERDA